MDAAREGQGGRGKKGRKRPCSAEEIAARPDEKRHGGEEPTPEGGLSVLFLANYRLQLAGAMLVITALSLKVSL